jgi:uncharacterized membrane protein
MSPFVCCLCGGGGGRGGFFPDVLVESSWLYQKLKKVLVDLN